MSIQSVVTLPLLLVPFEVQINYKRPLFSSLKWIDTSQKANDLIREYTAQESLDVQEHFWLLTLSNANRAISVSKLCSGSISGVIMPIRLIAQTTLLTNAVGAILIHNHPSGLLKPSRADLGMTEKIKNGLKLLDLNLLDHLIITSESYYSMADEGII